MESDTENTFADDVIVEVTPLMLDFSVIMETGSDISLELLNFIAELK